MVQRRRPSPAKTMRLLMTLPYDLPGLGYAGDTIVQDDEGVCYLVRQLRCPPHLHPRLCVGAPGDCPCSRPLPSPHPPGSRLRLLD